jgi:hypothetical protein
MKIGIRAGSVVPPAVGSFITEAKDDEQRGCARFIRALHGAEGQRCILAAAGVGESVGDHGLAADVTSLEVGWRSHPHPDRFEVRLAVGADRVVQRERGLQLERLATACCRDFP